MPLLLSCSQPDAEGRAWCRRQQPTGSLAMQPVSRRRHPAARDSDLHSTSHGIYLSPRRASFQVIPDVCDPAPGSQ